jgi:lipoic acid synthetase
VDWTEPKRVADSVAEMGLRHVVITMVNRDELKDGGASVMAQTVRAIHHAAPDCSVEVLTSDFMGDREAIALVMESKPEIFSHNIETIRRLTPQVRSRSDYDRSLQVLKAAQQIDPKAVVKSSMMLGLGESVEEIHEAMADLLKHGARVMNLGQYLQPTRRHLPVQKYWSPDEFASLKEKALELGFLHCESGPLVRSSYHAGEDYESYRKKIHPLAQDEELARKL